MTVNKTLITLTHLYASEGHISFALTDGITTLRGNTFSKKNLSLDIAYLAWELTNGEHVAKDLLAANPRENMKRYFRFAIDKEVAEALAVHYKQNGEDTLIKVAEDVINLFDSVNGNNAVSQAMGIANLVRSIQDGDVILAEADWINKLTTIIFETKAWDVEHQGVKLIQETLDDGTKIDLNVVQAVGNVFVSGSIGKVHVRIFKAQVINIYTSWDDTFQDDNLSTFNLYNRAEFIAGIKGLIDVSNAGTYSVD